MPPNKSETNPTEPAIPDLKESLDTLGRFFPFLEQALTHPEVFQLRVTVSTRDIDYTLLLENNHFEGPEPVEIIE